MDAEARENIELRDYLQILQRRRWVIVVTFLTVFFSVLFHTLRTRPVYEAFTTVQIKQSSSQNNILGNLARRGEGIALETEMALIKSRIISEEVAKELILNQRVFDKSPGLTFNLSQVKLEEEDKGEYFIISFPDSSGVFSVYDHREDLIGTGKAESFFKSTPISFLISSVSANPGDSFKLKVTDLSQSVEMLQRNTGVELLGNATNIIKISFRSDDRLMTQRIVNKIAQVYQKHNISRKNQEAWKTLEFIKNQLEVYQKNLEKAEEDLDTYKTKEGIIILDEEVRALVDKISKFEMTKAEVNLQKRQMKDLHHSLRRSVNQSNEYLLTSTSLQEPLITGLVSQLSKLELQRKTLLETLTEKHPQIIHISAQAREIKEKILQTIKNSVDALEKREISLKKVIEEYEVQLMKLPQAERQLARLARSSKVNEEIYTFLLKRHEEARIAMASTTGNINIIDPAIVPKAPIKPDLKKSLLLGALVGLILGFGFAFFLEYLDDTVKSIEEVEEKVNLPVFGTIPHMANADPSTSVKKVIITQIDPHAPGAESYRSLRTNIQFADLENPLKTILFTSASPEEGKTTTVANLAITMAQAGSRTLILDCDLRKPILHTIFDREQEPGLTDILLGKKSWKEINNSTGIENLDFLSTGAVPPNPSELLGTPKMKKVIEELKNHYDFILLESPPAIAVTDSIILSSFLDGTFLVIGSGQATIESVTRAKSLLEKVHTKIKGAILNNIKEEGKKYQYYYQHAYYGKTSQKPAETLRAKTYQSIRDFLLH